MKYCGVIQDLAASGFNWCFYDENCCLLNQAQPSSFRWCNIHWELWMRAQHSTASKPQTLPGCLRSHEQGIPKGFCVKFHRGVQCVPGCAFKHLCYKFEGPQKASQCNFRSQSKNTRMLFRLFLCIQKTTIFWVWDGTRHISSDKKGVHWYQWYNRYQ